MCIHTHTHTHTHMHDTYTSTFVCVFKKSIQTKQLKIETRSEFVSVIDLYTIEPKVIFNHDKRL